MKALIERRTWTVDWQDTHGDFSLAVIVVECIFIGY